MAGRPRRSYEHHAGEYRMIVPGDVTKTWEWSPVSTRSLPMSPMRPVFEIPKALPNIPSGLLPAPNLGMVAEPISKKKGIWAAIRQFFQAAAVMPENEAVIQITSDPTQPEHLSWPKVEPHEWKQYGYWARPFVNGVVCPNSPVNSERSVRTDVLRDIIINLKGEGDYEKYPERWVPGIKHRALPSRPTRWNLPIPGEPLPFPWEVQLNPLLQHLVFGPSPLSWHLGTDPFVLLAYGRCDGISYVKPADRAQPATWPFLTYMHFNAVLGDTAPRYPWPFTVHNPRGIKCGDILTTIYDEFQKPILEDERGSWPAMRVMAVEAAHKRRLELVEPPENTLLRCDFLGGVAWFRGIEPTPDGEGWMMSFGTH